MRGFGKFRDRCKTGFIRRLTVETTWSHWTVGVGKYAADCYVPRYRGARWLDLGPWRFNIWF